MSRQRGWVSVSVQTYQSHRTSAQRILQQEYTVDESGATLNARVAGSRQTRRQGLGDAGACLMSLAAVAGLLCADFTPPRVTINLDTPPEHRWDAVAAAYNSSLWAALAGRRVVTEGHT